jgi:hypothetical protein
LNQVVVEIVDRRPRVDHDPLGMDAAGSPAEQKGHRVGRLFDLHGLCGV